MNKTIFTGCATAIATPMKADGSINYDEFGKLIDWQIESGIDALVICGTTGDSATMTDDEHREVIRYGIKRIQDERINQFDDPLNKELFGYYSSHRNDIVDPKSELYKLKQQYDAHPTIALKRKRK